MWAYVAQRQQPSCATSIYKAHISQHLPISTRRNFLYFSSNNDNAFLDTACKFQAIQLKHLAQTWVPTSSSLQTSCPCGSVLAPAYGAAALKASQGSPGISSPTGLQAAGMSQTASLSGPPPPAHLCNHKRLHTLADHSQACPPPAATPQRLICLTTRSSTMADV